MYKNKSLINLCTQKTCFLGCPVGTFGGNCLGTCNCIEGTCDPKDGQCTCNPGYSGRLCNESKSIVFKAMHPNSFAHINMNIMNNYRLIYI